MYLKFIKKAKRLSIKREIESSKNVARATWKIINRSMGKSEMKKENIKIKICPEQPECEDPMLVGKAFNEYYTSIASKLIGTVDAKGTTKENPCKFSMFLDPVTENDVILAFSKLKSKKCSGHDNVTDDIVKKCYQPLIQPLTHLIQCSFQEGVFPDILKISKVIPLHKKDDKNNMTNYRPVANITVFAKIFEHVMDRKLRSYLYKFKLISPSQYGFIKGKSTSDAIVDFIHLIYGAFDKRHFVTGLLFDMSKAFDLVDHSILIKKLESHGIRGNVLKWFVSYLKDRMQLVEINYNDGSQEKLYRSSLERVLYGVPQGSVLGPLLFIIFINDLNENIKSGTLVNFADDANVLLRALTLEELESKIENAFKEMKSWCDQNKLVLNDSKTNMIQFRTNEKGKLNSTSQYKNLYVPQAKFLGITIDQYLRWQQHLEVLQSKLSRAIFGIRSLRGLSDEKTALLAYHGMFHSLISYGTLIWGNGTLVNDIFILQKRAIRSIYKLSSRTSCRPFFQKSNIMTVPSIYIYELLKFVKQNREQFCTNDNVHDYNTRQKLNLHTPRFLLKVSQNDIYHKGARMYNLLPPKIRDLPFQRFKNSIKANLVKCCFYNIEDYLVSGFGGVEGKPQTREPRLA
jgi:hypothetical protein